MKRSDFIKRVAISAMAGIPIMAVINACSSSADEPAPGTTPPSTKDCLANGTSLSIGSNHGHSMTVSKDDVSAGVEKSYEIQGSSSHPHTIVISSSQFDSLKKNTSIDVTSTSNSGHTHSVTVGCAW